MTFQWYGLINIDEEKLKYTVLLSKYEDKYILIRNRSRTIWELPGGKREEDESILQSAGRELFEETGAVEFELTPIGIYSINESFGMVYFADVIELGELPDFEIEEIRFVEELPEGLNYGNVYYELFDKWKEHTVER